MRVEVRGGGAVCEMDVSLSFTKFRTGASTGYNNFWKTNYQYAWVRQTHDSEATA